MVINSEKDLWGAYEYKPEKDVLRVTVKPTAAEPQEWMEFTFEDLTPNSANLVLRWEKLRVAVPIVVDVNGKTLAGARAAIAAMKSDDWRTPYQAASFCFTNDVAMDEGLKWLEQSLAIQQTYQNLGLQARWQMKQGKKAERAQDGRQGPRGWRRPARTSRTPARSRSWWRSGRPSSERLRHDANARGHPAAGVRVAAAALRGAVPSGGGRARRRARLEGLGRGPRASPPRSRRRCTRGSRRA